MSMHASPFLKYTDNMYVTSTSKLNTTREKQYQRKGRCTYYTEEDEELLSHVL